MLGGRRSGSRFRGARPFRPVEFRRRRRNRRRRSECGHTGELDFQPMRRRIRLRPHLERSCSAGSGRCQKAVAAADPIAIATAYSNASPDTAYGLADLLRSVASVKVDDFNAKVRAALDRDKLRELAKHEAFLEDAFIFSKFCASVVWWDENLALEMAELFVPTAQQVLAKDPVEGFRQLSHDFASTVLHVFDVLGVYVGQQKPTRRQSMIARRMCEKIDPSRSQITYRRCAHGTFNRRASSSISSPIRRRGSTKRHCANSIGKS